MRTREIVEGVLDFYPKIFHACHSRHVRDPKTREVVSANQTRVLDHLDDVEPTSLMGLARHMGVSASTMSLTVDRLVRRDYVTRSRDPVDGRVVNLRLTSSGARLRDAQSVLDPARVKAIILRLSAGERLDALRGLGLLARAASEEMVSKSAKTGRARKQQLPDSRERRKK